MVISKRTVKEVNIGNLRSLKHLRLKSHSVERITLKSLNALEKLSLDINYQLTKLQTDLYDQIPNIELLSVDCMDLFTYTVFILEKRVSIRKMRNDEFSSVGLICNRIEKLSITHCSVKHLSKLFRVCDKFRDILELDISVCEDTKIEKKMFSDGFTKLRSLKILRSKNFLIIDHDSFSILKQLVSLDLSGNFLESIDKRTFSELANLEALNLSGNRIKSLDENIFSDLKNLRQLDLSSNRLEKLDSRLFIGLENLCELNLSGNKLTHFDLLILDNLPRLRKVNLSGNLIKKDNVTEILNRFKESAIESEFN